MTTSNPSETPVLSDVPDSSWISVLTPTILRAMTAMPDHAKMLADVGVWLTTAANLVGPHEAELLDADGELRKVRDDCACGEAPDGTVWCPHRLAFAIAKRAIQAWNVIKPITRDKEGPSDAYDAPTSLLQPQNSMPVMFHPEGSLSKNIAAKKTSLRTLSPTLPVISVQDQLSLATAFFQSGVFSDIRDQAQALVKIVKGQELGLPPMAAMQNIDLLTVKGRTNLSVRAHAAAAILRCCGYGRYHVQESTKERCTIGFSERQPDGQWIMLPPITYTLAQAQEAHLIREDGPWKIDPEVMLYNRAVKRGIERYFPELLRGLTITESLPVPTDAQAANTIAELYGE